MHTFHLKDRPDIQQKMDKIVAKNCKKWRKNPIAELQEQTFPDGSKYSDELILKVVDGMQPPVIGFIIH